MGQGIDRSSFVDAARLGLKLTTRCLVRLAPFLKLFQPGLRKLRANVSVHDNERESSGPAVLPKRKLGKGRTFVHVEIQPAAFHGGLRGNPMSGELHQAANVDLV